MDHPFRPSDSNLKRSNKTKPSNVSRVIFPAPVYTHSAPIIPVGNPPMDMLKSQGVHYTRG